MSERLLKLREENNKALYRTQKKRESIINDLVRINLKLNDLRTKELRYGKLITKREAISTTSLVLPKGKRVMHDDSLDDLLPKLDLGYLGPLP